MRIKLLFTLGILLTVGGETAGYTAGFHSKKKSAIQKEDMATVTVDAGLPQCEADVDNRPEGMTGSTGRLAIQEIEPGDHYLHVRCPGMQEVTRFLTPQAGERLRVTIKPTTRGSLAAAASALDTAASEVRLRRLVRQAVQLRSAGQFPEAVKLLREATLLDPENSDLHREIGITFLLTHEWERARVEMLEAIHEDPDNADAHSALAYADEKLGNLDEALKQYRICTHLDPGDASYQRHYIDVLGRIYGRDAQRKR